MATIRKRGKSYQIRVSCGYNSQNEQIIRTMTYKPLPNMTERQIKKELDRQAVLFEEKCLNGLYMDSNIKLADFTEKWLSDYAEKQLKKTTVSHYKGLLKRISEAMGHLRLDRIQPHHLMEFYSNLEETGIREDKLYCASCDFANLLKENNLTMTKCANLAGVSIDVIRSCINKKSISYKSKEKISSFLGRNDVFIEVETDGKLSPKTIQHYHRALSIIFETAVKWQIIPNNPCQRVQPPKVPQKEAEYLDENETMELLELLKSAPLKYRVMITLLLYSGMRRGELLALKWSDVDMENCKISITKELIYLPEYGVYEDTPKNKTSDRVISIPREVIDILKSYRVEQSKTRLAVGDLWEDNGLVFSSDFGKAIRPTTLSKWFRDFVRANNLKNIHIHSLRHTNATLLIAAGTNLQTVSKRLGHATPITTGNIYSHAIKSADELASDTLADILHPVKRTNNA